MAILQLLRQGTSILLENIEPMQKLYRQIETQLTEDLAVALTPTAFIESYYFQVQEAKNRIGDRQTFQQAATQLKTDLLKAKELKQQDNELAASSLTAKQSLKDLEAKRDELT